MELNSGFGFRADQGVRISRGEEREREEKGMRTMMRLVKRRCMKKREK